MEGNAYNQTDLLPIGIVINHYNPGLDRKLTYQALHCIGTYLAQTVPVSVVLSDGSGIPDPILEQESARSGFKYLRSERRLFFAEGYNAGISYLQKAAAPDSLIALTANDIFPSSQTLGHLKECLLSEDRIGCAVPYLSWSDFRIQSDENYPRRRLLRYMTLNLNLFRMEDLRSIGGVPTEYSGYFNDVVMAIRLNQLGKQVGLCYSGKVFHQHRSTTSISTLSSFEKDRHQFLAQYPALESSNSRRPFALSKLTSGFWSAFYSTWEMRGASAFQNAFRRIERWIFAIEKWLFRNLYYPVYKRMEDPYKDVR